MSAHARLGSEDAPAPTPEAPPTACCGCGAPADGHPPFESVWTDRRGPHPAQHRRQDPLCATCGVQVQRGLQSMRAFDDLPVALQRLVLGTSKLTLPTLPRRRGHPADAPERLARALGELRGYLDGCVSPGSLSSASTESATAVACLSRAYAAARASGYAAEVAMAFLRRALELEPWPRTIPGRLAVTQAALDALGQRERQREGRPT